MGLGLRLLRRSCYPVGTSGAWRLELDELSLRFLKTDATRLMLVSLRELCETGPGNAKKTKQKTSKDQKDQVLPPGPSLKQY